MLAEKFAREKEERLRRNKFQRRWYDREYQKEEQNQAYIFINVKKSKIMPLLPIGAHTHSRYAAFLPAQFFMVEQH